MRCSIPARQRMRGTAEAIRPGPDVTLPSIEFRELLCGALECGSLLPLFTVNLLAVI